MLRTPAHPIDPLFLRRWSPRAMSGAPVAREQLLTLLEAARWAPSSGNGQPWRFAYALAGTPHFDRFLATLVLGNRVWCVRAGALVLVAAKVVRDDGRPAATAPFDAGAAWMGLALQGTISGLVVHAMEGFDHEAARAAVELPAGLEPQAMVAVGLPGRVEDLPEKLREQEQPNDRKPLAEVAVEGRFPVTPSPIPE
jgi:nitroreductase